MKKETPSQSSIYFIYIIKKPELWASLALILGFFLPWFSNPVFKAPGYQISSVLDFFSIASPVSGILMVVTFLIPLGGISIIILSLLKKPTPLPALIVGMLPVIVISVLHFNNPYILKQLSAGSIMTFFSGLCLLLSGAIKQNIQNRQKK